MTTIVQVVAFDVDALFVAIAGTSQPVTPLPTIMAYIMAYARKEPITIIETITDVAINFLDLLHFFLVIAGISALVMIFLHFIIPSAEINALTGSPKC